MRAAIERYDVFHFNFGQTQLQVRQFGRVTDELPLLRRLAKTVIMTYEGCDVRPFDHCHCRSRDCIATTGYRRPLADCALRYAYRVFHLNADLGRWLPGARFLPYANVDPRTVQPVPPAERDELVPSGCPR